MNKSLFSTILLLVQVGASVLQTDCSAQMVTHLTKHGMR